MRIALALGLLGWAAVLVPCPAQTVQAQSKASRCCCGTGPACCCRGDGRQAPAREPATPTAKAGPDTAADVTLAPATGAEIESRAAGTLRAEPAGFDPGPVYLSTRSFRC